MLNVERVRSDFFLVDDFNIYLVGLTTFVAFSTSIFSASYIDHELENGKLTPRFVRFYHALYQAMLGAMNLALVANNFGLLWVGVEVATLSTVMMVGIYRTPEALEAAWKYFILGSVGIALAFFGTILIYLSAQDVLGQGLAAMAWDQVQRSGGRLDPNLLSLAFVFLLVGYGTKVGIAPFHAWLPDAHAEGPTPISAVLSGLLLNVALYALLRFKMILAGNAATLNVGYVMMGLGLVSLVFAALMLYRRRDIKRLFAYSSIEHMGIMTFAFGLGGPLANFAGLLHMTMHALTKSAIFFAVGHIAQIKGTQRLAQIRGLSESNPLLATGFALAVVAIAGLPPFGVFMSEFMLVAMDQVINEAPRLRYMSGGQVSVPLVLKEVVDSLDPARAALAFPLSLLAAIIVLDRFGFGINTLTLGGLAIAIGMMVDGSVVVVENAFSHLGEHAAAERVGSAVDAVLLDGRWKGIRLQRRTAPIELYDLAHDLGETQNLAEQQPEKVARARELFTTARIDSPDWPVKDAPLGKGKPAK